MYVTSCALAAIKDFKRNITPKVTANEIIGFLQILLSATYSTIPSTTAKIAVAIYIAVNPPIPVFSPNWYTK